MAASLFVLGNIVLPQLFHLMPQGGITWLPIYFFTLVGTYKYKWNIGAADIHLSAEEIQKIDTALNNMEMSDVFDRPPVKVSKEL